MIDYPDFFKNFFRLRERKEWWQEIVFYFILSALLSVIFCYLIFLTKNYFLQKRIQETVKALETVGTPQQQEYEQVVLTYQKRFNEFNKLISNHRFSYRVFLLTEKLTWPNAWFYNFVFDRKNRKIQLTGETTDLDATARQVFYFERDKEIESVGNLTARLDQNNKFQITFNFIFKPTLLEYQPDLLPQEPLEEAVVEPLVEPVQEKNLILVFNLLLHPEVVGKIDQENGTITLDVPYGTNLKNIQPLIITSRGAQVLPLSGVAQDFSRPLTYTVTGEDGSVRVYTVIARVLPPPLELEKQVEKKKYNQTLVFLMIIIMIAIIAGAGYFVFKKRREIKDKILSIITKNKQKEKT
mgnify:CR=1 FL=1